MDPAPTSPIDIPITADTGTQTRDGDGNITGYTKTGDLTLGGSAIQGSADQTTITVGISGTATAYVNTGAATSGVVRISPAGSSTHRVGDPFYVSIENPTADATLTIAGSSSVTLGHSATFTISANPPADKDIVVEVMIGDLASKSTNFVMNETRYIRLPATMDSYTFEVKTSIPYETITDPDGNEKEQIVAATNDGIIEARLVDGEGYNPDTTDSNDVAYVEVQDPRIIDPVILSVTADATTVHHGEMVTFTVTRTGDTTNALEL